MSNYKFAFYISEKSRTHNWGYMLQEGAKVHGDVIKIIKQEDFNPSQLQEFDGAANLGMARACKRLMDAWRGAGKHFLYFDKGYMGERNINWRVSIDAWQPLAYFQRFKRASDRFDALKIDLKDRKRLSLHTDKIVLAGACQNYHNFCDLGTVTDWCWGLVREIREFSDRTIVYRPNPSWARRHNDEFSEISGTELSHWDTPFSEALKNCHLLVTHGSSAAVGALMAGVPVMVTGGGIARPMGLDNIQGIDNPFWPKRREREQFCYDLSYCQWTMDEYRNGAAWAEIRLALAYLEGGPRDVITMGDLLQQYKIMHTSDKYFRGLSIVKHMAKIGKIIIETGSKTVLDYGSGKGEQYEEPYKLQIAWDLQFVTCYDPAVEEYDELPDHTFDGVVCVDVMEHIPETEVQDTLQKIIGFANKFVFFAIASAPAKKTMPDGRNCHLTVRPEAWWQDQIRAATLAVMSVRRGEQMDLVVRVVVTGEDNAEG